MTLFHELVLFQCSPLLPLSFWNWYQPVTCIVHRLCGLNNRHLFSSSFRGQKSQSKVLAVLVSPEVFLLGLHMLPSICNLTWPFLICFVCVLISCFYSEAHHIRLRPTHMNSFYLNHLVVGPIFIYSHILRYGGLELQHMKFEGTQFRPQHFPSKIRGFTSIKRSELREGMVGRGWGWEETKTGNFWTQVASPLHEKNEIICKSPALSTQHMSTVILSGWLYC